MVLHHLLLWRHSFLIEHEKLAPVKLHKVLTLEIKPTADFFDGINVRQTARDDELLKDFALIR